MSVFRVLACDKSILFAVAHPSAALVGVPSELYAALSEGPLICSWLSGCLSSMELIINAKRRGVAYQLESPKVKLAYAKTE